MRQPSLRELLLGEATLPPPVMPEVYDFFASAGGFSEGARQAGCKVAWVCDNDPVALKTHAENHPQTVHCEAELPMRRKRLPFPKDGRPFHAHFSPPCQKFSPVNQRHRHPTDRKGASDLITWSLKTALRSGATSWSLEQVASSAVIALVEAMRRRHPKRIAYAKIDFAELGVPQRRIRLIAGPPVLVARLLRLCSAANVRGARHVITKPRGTHLRNGKGWTSKHRGADGKWRYVKASWQDNCIAIRRPAPTVLADRGMNWVTRRGHKVVGKHPRLRMREYADLQTFPPTYQFPSTEQLALKHIGNAVPPLVARLIMSGDREATTHLTAMRQATVGTP